MNSDFSRQDNVAVTSSSNTNLELRGIVDINGDGNNDILNYNTNTGKLRAWLMDGQLKITENAEIAQDTDSEWSIRGGYSVQSPDIIYFLEKDANNKIFIEKTVNGDLIVTEIVNSKYKTRKFLLDGDDNVFEMEYQADGVKLTYNDETEFININETAQEQEIESQYIGIWREDVDEDWEGDIDIAYIYTDKAIVFSGNIATGACSKAGILDVSEFQSLLKNDIDVDDYVKATTYKSRIETACGNYASLSVSLVQERLSKDINTEEFESQINNTIDEFRKAPLTTLFGGTIAGGVVISIFEWGKTKVNNISDKMDRVKHSIDSSIDKVKEFVGIKAPAPVYDNVKSKVDNNDLSGLKENIDNFDNHEKLNDDNSFNNETTFTYHQLKNKDDSAELQVTKVQAYDLNNEKVEEVPNYDEAGTITSVTIKTNFDENGGYESEIVKTNSNNSIQYNKITGIDGDVDIGYYTRIARSESYDYYTVYIHNVASNSSDLNQDILNSLNEVNFTLKDIIGYDYDNKIYKLANNITPETVNVKFWANWGRDGDAYSSCYDTSVEKFLISYIEGPVINEYNQISYIFKSDFIFNTIPVEFPNDYCKQKNLKSFKQSGHIEFEVGTYWPN
jgi:hypothetical protein